MVTVAVELPQEILELLGPPEDVAASMRESLIMGLLRDGRISQGSAARVLGVTRWDLLPLLGRYRVHLGAETVDELEQEVAASLDHYSRHGSDADHQ